MTYDVFVVNLPFMRPLGINPGGLLDLAEIVGRQQEIRKYWKVLARQGLVLSAERRIGKTHIVRKMHQEGHEGFATFYQDLEGVHGLTELVRAIYRSVEHQLSTVGRAKMAAVSMWTTVLPKKLGALEMPEAQGNWKSLLSEAVKDVLDAVDTAHKVVLIWDEFPLMLYNLHKAAGVNSVIHLLDLLRSLRQQNGRRLRFLFTGSIGLHLVIRTLRLAGNANEPVNDMQQETVPPMREDEAIELASRLLCGLEHPPAAIEPLAKRIYTAVEGFPYYIHHMVDRLESLGRKPTIDDIAATQEALICADDDPAQLSYYLKRISTYYNAEEARLSLLVLDAIAAHDGGTTVEELLNLVRHQSVEVDEEQLREVCLLLRRDHYLTLETRGDGVKVHDFRWGVVRQWWRMNRS